MPPNIERDTPLTLPSPLGGEDKGEGGGKSTLAYRKRYKGECEVKEMMYEMEQILFTNIKGST